MKPWGCRFGSRKGRIGKKFKMGKTKRQLKGSVELLRVRGKSRREQRSSTDTNESKERGAREEISEQKKRGRTFSAAIARARMSVHFKLRNIKSGKSAGNVTGTVLFLDDRRGAKSPFAKAERGVWRG